MYYFVADEDIDHPGALNTVCVQLGQIIPLGEFHTLCEEFGVDNIHGYIVKGLHLAKIIREEIRADIV